MLSTLDEMTGRITLLEQELRSYSEKMLLSVAVRYGRDSLPYVQAGGTPRKRTTRHPASPTPTTAIAPIAPSNPETNGKGEKVTVN